MTNDIIEKIRDNFSKLTRYPDFSLEEYFKNIYHLLLRTLILGPFFLSLALGS